MTRDAPPASISLGQLDLSPFLAAQASVNEEAGRREGHTSSVFLSGVCFVLCGPASRMVCTESPTLTGAPPRSTWTKCPELAWVLEGQAVVITNRYRGACYSHGQHPACPPTRGCLVRGGVGASRDEGWNPHASRLFSGQGCGRLPLRVGGAGLPW